MAGVALSLGLTKYAVLELLAGMQGFLRETTTTNVNTSGFGEGYTTLGANARFNIGAGWPNITLTWLTLLTGDGITAGGGAQTPEAEHVGNLKISYTF